MLVCVMGVGGGGDLAAPPGEQSCACLCGVARRLPACRIDHRARAGLRRLPQQNSYVANMRNFGCSNNKTFLMAWLISSLLSFRKINSRTEQKILKVVDRKLALKKSDFLLK